MRCIVCLLLLPGVARVGVYGLSSVSKLGVPNGLVLLCMALWSPVSCRPIGAS